MAAGIPTKYPVMRNWMDVSPVSIPAKNVIERKTKK